MASDELKPTTVEERELILAWIRAGTAYGRAESQIILRLLADIKRRDERIAELEAAQQQTCG